MSVKPILFSGSMIRAILDGRKTQTRRIIKDVPAGARYAGIHYASHQHDAWFFNSPSGPCKKKVWLDPGDLLWVRESHYMTDDGHDEYPLFIADGEETIAAHLLEVEAMEHAHPTVDWSSHKKLRPSIHMPRWASRLTLEVTDVRIQRLQEISEGDAKAEGIAMLRQDRDGMQHWGLPDDGDGVHPRRASWAFARLWDSINASRGFGWDANPWVAAITFRVIRQNIDEYLESSARQAKEGA
mgnify:CR=1 FL=1